MRKLDRFTLADTIAQTDVASLVHATEALPAGASRPVLLKIFASTSKTDFPPEAPFACDLRNLAAIGPAAYILTFYTAGITDKYPWIALEPALTTLAAEIDDVPAEPKLVARVLEHLLTALAAIHGKSLLHNAIHPDNIAVAADQSIKLTELSLAAAPAADTTQQAAMVRYSAPEAIHKDFGKPSPSTDLYALGQVAYELALGTRLWRSQFPAVFEPGSRPKDTVNPAKWMAWHCSATTKLPSVVDLQRNFPPALAAVIDRLTAKDPTRRFATADEALAGVRTAAAAPVTSAAPESRPATRGGNLAPIPLDEPAAPAPRHSAPGSQHAPAPSQNSEIRTQNSPSAPLDLASDAPPAPAPVGTTYYIRMRGRQSGPFDFATLQRYARSGQVSRLHQVSTDGTSWRPATTIDGLFT